MMKNILFSFLFLLLCLPFFQEKLHPFNPKPLDGVELKAEPDTLNTEAWFAGRFQAKREQRINEDIGLREFYIRLYNQYNYSLFNVSESPGVVVGKQNFLYLTSYTNNFSGKNYLGYLTISSNVTRLKMLQDSLKKKNIDLIVVFAPGKASFYPEYIPDELLSKQHMTNYREYKKLFHSSGVNFLDLNALFQQMKDTSSIKLYPKYGVHWSYYGAYIAADTTKKFIEKIHGNRLPEMNMASIEFSDSLKNPDYDVGELMNIFTHEKDTMPYPKIIYSDVENMNKPSGVIISDSYTWHWIELNFLQNIFNEWAFWFYNNTMYPESFTNKISTGDINYLDAFLKKDVVIVMASEAAYDLFPYSLLEKTEMLYIPSNKAQLVDYYKMKIKGDRSWFQKVIIKAKTKKITIEEALQADAEWLCNNLKEN